MLDCRAIKHPFLTTVPARTWGVRPIGFACPGVDFENTYNIPVVGWLGADWLGLGFA